MASTFSSLLRKLDVFGYPITLYFHQHDYKYRSRCGIISTTIAFALLSISFVMLCLRIRDPEYQKITYQTYDVNLANSDTEFKLDDQFLRWFYVVRINNSPLSKE